MSDFYMYEVLKLEDIRRDAFHQNDDHIVPHQGYETGIGLALWGNSFKKPRCEVIGISSTGAESADSYTAKYVCQGKGYGAFQALKNTRDTMLDNNFWSHTPEGVFPASHGTDSNKNVTSLAADNTSISNNCFKSSKMDTIATGFYDGGSIIGEKCDMVDSDSYGYSLGDISQTDNDLSFLDNDHEDKECNDMLYDGWFDMRNFDYADRMFSCDSTLALGGIGHEGELNWLTSSPVMEGSEGALNSDFKFSSLDSSSFKDKAEQHEPSKCSSVSDSNMDSSSMRYKSSLPASEDGAPDTLGHLTFMNCSNAVSESDSGSTSKEQILLHKKQAKHHKETEGKRKDQCFENGGSFHHSGNIWFEDMKLHSEDSSHQAFASPHIVRQKENIPASSTSSVIKSKTNDLVSLSAKQSSYAENQVVSVDISHDSSFESSIPADDKSEKLPHREGFQSSLSGNPSHVDLTFHTVSCHPISASKHVRHSQNEAENGHKVEVVNIRIPADLDTSNVQESSCMSSGLDESSLEASSFHQLQQIMEQLDISTKKCIRDSLYRLARSAEQRHHYTNLKGGSIDGRDISEALGTNNCNGLMEIETDTNPIDRSIAHLLFHRPMDSSAMPASGGLSLKSHTMISGSIMSPRVIAKKLISQEESEETANEADKSSS